MNEYQIITQVNRIKKDKNRIMKKLLPVLCIIGMLTFAIEDAKSQDNRFGIKGGLGFYKITGDISVSVFDITASESFDTDYQMGFHG